METCRTCAKCDFDNESQWLDLYNSPQWAEETKRIHTELNIWKIKISCNDGLPQKICNDCYTKFSTVSVFRLQCLEAQQILSNIFDKIDSQSIQDDEVFEGFEQASEEDNDLISSTAPVTPTKLMRTTQYSTSSTSSSTSSSSSSSSCSISAITPTKAIESKYLKSDTRKYLINAPTTKATTTTRTTATTILPNDILNLNNTKNTEVSLGAVQPVIASKIKQQTDTAIVVTNDKKSCCNNDNLLIDNSNLITSITNTNCNKNDEIILTEDTNDLDENDLIEELIDELDFIEELNTTNYNDEEEEEVEEAGDENDEEDYDNMPKDQQQQQLQQQPQFQDQNQNNIYLNETELNCADDDDDDDGDTVTIKQTPLHHNDNDNENNCIQSNNLKITFECKYCYKWKNSASEIFQTQQELLAHLTQLHNSELPYNCPYCIESFRDNASRTTHLKESHSQKLHSCDTCGKKYADKFNLRNHVEKYHSGTDFDCALCAKSFCSSKSLNYHMKWHNPNEQLKCSYCDRLFINQRHLKCHEETHTGFRSQEVCSFCGKYFYHLKTLRWHIFRQHGGEKPYKCSRCTEVFISYFEKRLHMLQFHLDNLTLIEKTECMLCHQRYDNEHVLIRHMLEEHKENKGCVKIANNKRIIVNKKPKSFTGLFHCEKCEKRFNMKSALERHQAVHSTEGRPHACPQCPKRFKRSQDMKWHLKTHSTEKPNVCDVCGKGFALKYVLTQHRRSHEVLEKNFTCSTCGRSYLFEKSLRLHERIHSGKTYYKCDLCSESFVTHIKFKCHMKKMHEDEDEVAATNLHTPIHTNNTELPYADDLVNIVIT